MGADNVASIDSMRRPADDLRGAGPAKTVSRKPKCFRTIAARWFVASFKAAIARTTGGGRSLPAAPVASDTCVGLRLGATGKRSRWRPRWP